MQLRTIVVGVDFSAHAEEAARQAVGLARRTGARVILAHVTARLDDNLAFVPHGSIVEFQRMLEDQRAADLERLSTLAAALRDGVTITVHEAEGYADVALVELARAASADVIAVGTHGRTGLRRLLMGSVSERVMRLATQDVLVARARPVGDEAPGAWQRLLVPTDFSPHAERALARAVELAPPGARIDLLHCWDVPILTAEMPLPLGVTIAVPEAARKNAEELIARYERPELTIAIEIIQGSPKYLIHERAAGHDAVIMGSHGHRGWRRLLLGSVAESTVRHAPCSVMVVHLPPEPAG
jgi:nucleotide-binding universal stress UspA family protein